ncbi:UNVERIFIED_CONTAM: hypothetical protein GTU68_028977 [Idotea baltica]|nr:hypothetical protein [Idotea baltica]
MVILMDDEDRENEGDLLMAATMTRPEDINFMATHGRGLICLTLSEERCRQLSLPLMVDANNASHGTNFTLSIEAAEGVTTGISAADRARTVQAAVASNARPKDIVQPGHIFPLQAEPGGVLSRAGHTEAGCDLARIAGFEPAAVIVEIMNDDGTMARREDLEAFAKKHDLKIGTIADLIHYRLVTEKTINCISEREISTQYGQFVLKTYLDSARNEKHFALVMGDVSEDEPVLLRLHSECLTGDALFSVRCDCGAQLEEAMRLIAEEGRGAILYLRQEGRGIGLLNKIKAYHLQDQGADTVEANEQLGFGADMRNYSICKPMLEHLNVSKVRLLTNNPRKVEALKELGFTISERVALQTGRNPHNLNYLATKAGKLGHLFDTQDGQVDTQDDQDKEGSPQ